MTPEVPQNLEELAQVRDEKGLFGDALVGYMQECHPDLYKLKQERGYIIDGHISDGTLATCWYTIMQVRENRKARLEATAINEPSCNPIDEEHHVAEDVANDDVLPAVSLDIVPDTGE